MSLRTTGNFQDRIQNVIEELASIREELSSPATDPKTGIAIAKVSVDALHPLKATIDEFRLFLWAYMDSWTQGHGDATSRLRRIRMDAATDMLRRLSEDFEASGMPDSAESSRLREQVRYCAAIMLDSDQ